MYLLDLNDDIPRLSASIVMNADLRVSVSVNKTLVSVSQYKHLVPDCLTHMSQLVNLMALLKCWTTDVSSRPLSVTVDMAVNTLKIGLDNVDDDSAEHGRLSFAVEQLKLTATSKYARHYSPQTMVMSYLVHATSAAAYNAVLTSSLLCLPSVSTLNKVTKRLDCTSGLDNTGYLKLRVSKLAEQERTVVLIIDEIYVAKRVEYSGGDVQGLTADGTVASTLLCFMIKSLSSKYKDLVAMFPMCKLTAEKEHKCFKEVMATLHSISVRVVAVSVDNAAVNRKFYGDYLCNGSLSTHIIDSVTGQPIYLLFDPVHNLKNIYNNFLARKVFVCPPMAENLPDGCRAAFDDIIALHDLEATMPLKKAHRLTVSALHPKSVEKTSVQLAVSVFSESTRDALEFYSAKEGRTTWKGTAAFLSLIIKLWNVLNVKTRSKGRHKRDYTMDPVRSSFDWKLQFLREFAQFLEQWERSKMQGLSRETFLAVRHTCLSLADCASYLLDKLGFSYVLLGHLQSDAIESRFGWLRQMSGANYYVSMKQVLDSDRKIRAVSLLQFSGLSLQEIDAAIDNEMSDNDASEDTVADFIAGALTNDHWPSASDANIIFYVAGAMARSVVRCNKCEHCKEGLISTDTLTPLSYDESTDYSASTFLDDINRGGLSRPTEYTFMCALQCWRVFNIIKSSSDLTSKFLSATSHRSLFCKVMDRAVDEAGQTLLVDDNYCFKGHDLKTLVIRRFFNCIAKNLVRELTEKANPTSDQPSKKRKIAKLQSVADR